MQQVLPVPVRGNLRQPWGRLHHQGLAAKRRAPSSYEPGRARRHWGAPPPAERFPASYPECHGVLPALGTDVGPRRDGATRTERRGPRFVPTALRGGSPSAEGGRMPHGGRDVAQAGG